ncbi:hypothetical protein IU485_28045 [Nocardia cyriacigeorgica]|uniref:hypothetical protein n=1 Tax=Nocardia cyriacigeorgica TaxID=135487 RepID=UPI0018942D9E|nr:hypothetical protein [Nocardia cyriacigeorgica]MBF6085225.1 hypothetical protein [Nocardia cyriacigeorgica]
MDFVRGRYPWPKLFRFLARLPAGSHYRAAQDLDEDMARRILDAEAVREAAEITPSEDDQLPTVSSSAGYTHETYLLMMLYEAIQHLNSTLVAVNLPKGKKPPRVKPLPRPVSALDRERAKREMREVDRALAEMGF